MTPEEKSLLERTAKLVEENNGILRNLRRSKRVSTLIHVVYWVIIIGLSVGSYFVIEPFIKMLPAVLGAAQGDSSSAQSALEQLKSLQSMLGK